MGKTIKESIGEVDKCIKHIKYYVDHTFEFIEDEPIKTTFPEVYVTH